ncbi:MAG: hypothetical protein E7238_05765 [Sarcina sp.]|nr:hypothetical protein [Sarcina sp.]
MKKEKEKVKIKIREENDKISRSVRKGNKWKNLLIAAVLCFSLAACGSGPAPDPAQNTDGGHPASAETSLTSETAAQAIGHPETAWTAGASGTAGRASEIASGEKTDRSAASAISSERAAAAESSERAATAIAATAAESTERTATAATAAESTERTATAATAAESSESAATSAAALTSTAALEENFSREDSEEIETLIRDYIKNMSLEDKAAGLFILTPEALTGYGAVTEAGEATKLALEERHVAGLIYFTGNMESRDQVRQMLDNTDQWGGIDLQMPRIKDMLVVNGSSMAEASTAAAGKTAAPAEKSGETIHIPPFLAVDEEGGLVARVADSPIEVPYVGSMGAIGASGDPEAAYEAGNTIGGYLRELGFNLDFAPDADVLIDPSNQTIGERSFGTDPALCGRMVHRFVDGLHASGIASCIKHFPGLGDTETDTHTGGAWSSRTLEDYRSAEFQSFLGGIEAGTDMIMVSHLTNEALTGNDLPASMNGAVITDLLRKELGYEGVIITDSLQMGAVTDRFDSAAAAVTAIEAGADILLIPADYASAHQGILDAVETGRLSEERLDQSLFRILMARYRRR